MLSIILLKDLIADVKNDVLRCNLIPPSKGSFQNIPKTIKKWAYGENICKAQYNKQISRYSLCRPIILLDIHGVVSRFRICGGGDRYSVDEVESILQLFGSKYKIGFT